MKKKALRVLFPLLLSALACQPVIAIGWNEFLLLFILMTVLLGPPLYALARKISRKFKHRDKEK
ncbi:MAG TPA: hypothetical protein VK900_13430 [Anaerolineales bacterium]|nr:hypothetical protein [Anaerolineales bacterium]